MSNQCQSERGPAVSAQLQMALSSNIRTSCSLVTSSAAGNSELPFTVERRVGNTSPCKRPFRENEGMNFQAPRFLMAHLARCTQTAICSKKITQLAAT